MICLVTGANGFVGRSLCAHLAAQGHSVRRVVRTNPVAGQPVGEVVALVPDIGPRTEWHEALEGVETVVHLAARVHLRGKQRPSLDAYRAVNVEGTRRLAEVARASGVRRFVFMSSVKVNGEMSRKPFTEDDEPAPADPYAVSKWEAEQVLRGICGGEGMRCVILRPPLVYGPEVGANFFDLIRLVASGLPLPLGRIDNQRSLVYVGNLVDAIDFCVRDPRALNRLFLVSDGEDVSTPDLVRRIARALKVRARLVPVPSTALRIFGRIMGRSGSVERLLGSLQVDPSRLRAALNWEPPFSLDQGLEDTALWYRKRIAERR
jgi:nucleoside-diphosphate-sugar epimerase